MNKTANTFSLAVYDANHTLLGSASGLGMETLDRDYRDVLLYAKTGDAYYDLVFSRKYTINEPTLAWSSEENPPPAGGAKVFAVIIA